MRKFCQAEATIARQSHLIAMKYGNSVAIISMVQFGKSPHSFKLMPCYLEESAIRLTLTALVIVDIGFGVLSYRKVQYMRKPLTAPIQINDNTMEFTSLVLKTFLADSSVVSRTFEALSLLYPDTPFPSN